MDSSIATTQASVEPTLQVIEPDHDAYDRDRAAWNIAADLQPAAVVTATTVSEVQDAVRLAADRGLKIAPVTTGHLGMALPSLADTLLLRTDLGRTVDIDPVRRSARIPAGARWSDVVGAAAPHGLAAAHGSAPTVGAVGYLLGGGLSFYARRHGLASSHVTAIELVTADGEVRRVSADEHPDLFWALKGGGGNFGVVTAVELELLPYAEVFCGAAYWPIADAETLLPAWVEWTRSAPDSVTTSARFLRLPPLPDVPEPLRGAAVFAVDGAAIDEPDGRALISMLTDLASPIIDTWAMGPASNALGMHGDPEGPVPALTSHALLEDLDDSAMGSLQTLVGAEAATPLVFVELRQLGGALASADDALGAQSGIDGRFALLALGVPMDPAVGAQIEAAFSELHEALAPVDSGRRYLNFDDRGGPATNGYTPDAHARLLKARDEWDAERRFVGAHPVV